MILRTFSILHLRNGLPAHTHMLLVYSYKTCTYSNSEDITCECSKFSKITFSQSLSIYPQHHFPRPAHPLPPNYYHHILCCHTVRNCTLVCFTSLPTLLHHMSFISNNAWQFDTYCSPDYKFFLNNPLNSHHTYERMSYVQLPILFKTSAATLSNTKRNRYGIIALSFFFILHSYINDFLFCEREIISLFFFALCENLLPASPSSIFYVLIYY